MKAVLVISDRDNVATALEALEAGRSVDAGGAPVTVLEGIAAGHKLAIRAIASGEPVIKYGSPIGLATAAIPAGAHVHVHNLSSSRGRGDLDALAPPRVAEPPDDPGGRPAGSAGVAPTPAAGGPRSGSA